MTSTSADALQVTAVRKRFGGNQVVDGVSLAVHDGRITSLIGPNGAGKTTLFNIITGFLTADSGEVRCRGRPIPTAAPHAIVGLGLARSFQELRLFPLLSACDNVAVAVPKQPGERLVPLLLKWRSTNRFERQVRRRALELLEFVGLPDLTERAPDQLSYGQQKRLALARVLAADSDVICLDEPAAGLDPQALVLMADLLRKIAASGRAVLVIEHNLELVREISDEVVFLNLGRVEVEGAPAAVLDNPRVLHGFLGL